MTAAGLCNLRTFQVLVQITGQNSDIIGLIGHKKILWIFRQFSLQIRPRNNHTYLCITLCMTV